MSAFVLRLIVHLAVLKITLDIYEEPNLLNGSFIVPLQFSQLLILDTALADTLVK